MSYHMEVSMTTEDNSIFVDSYPVSGVIVRVREDCADSNVLYSFGLELDELKRLCRMLEVVIQHQVEEGEHEEE